MSLIGREYITVSHPLDTTSTTHTLILWTTWCSTSLNVLQFNWPRWHTQEAIHYTYSFSAQNHQGLPNCYETLCGCITEAVFIVIVWALKEASTLVHSYSYVICVQHLVKIT